MRTSTALVTWSRTCKSSRASTPLERTPSSQGSQIRTSAALAAWPSACRRLQSSSAGIGQARSPVRRRCRLAMRFAQSHQCCSGLPGSEGRQAAKAGRGGAFPQVPGRPPALPKPFRGPLPVPVGEGQPHAGAAGAAGPGPQRGIPAVGVRARSLECQRTEQKGWTGQRPEARSPSASAEGCDFASRLRHVCAPWPNPAMQRV
mmetsp:Transcript_98854/g.300039  ORF Transcript_98854/g.300039 Transcript_98854/m.300039 type:complete len:203 (-) Transcript_98854:360-968(-)